MSTSKKKKRSVAVQEEPEEDAEADQVENAEGRDAELPDPEPEDAEAENVDQEGKDEKELEEEDPEEREEHETDNEAPDEEDEEQEVEEENTEAEDTTDNDTDADEKDHNDSKKSGKPSGGRKRVARFSSATLKTKMSPAMLQNPITRKKIWANLMKMMHLRGYRWVQDRPPPADDDLHQLWPNNKGLLGVFHMHAVDDEKKSTFAGREPVYVIFCSKAGEPTLKSLQYPSRHILVVSDSLTGRARAALHALPVRSPPIAKSTLSSATEFAPNELTLKDVFVEAFTSTFFMFDLLKQQYLKVIQFKPLVPTELVRVFDTFERKRDIVGFPRMMESDPVARYFRVPVGSVIGQTRLSTAAAVQESYRVVFGPS